MPIARAVVLACLAFVLSVHPLGAQALLGHVVDDATGAPVSWTEVLLLDESGDTVATAMADSAGWFVLRWRGGGSLHVRASRLGYRPVTVGPLRVGPFQSLTLEVRLGVAALPLDPIRVIAEPRDRALERTGFYRRRRFATGRFITPLDIEARQPVFVEDLFRGIPGVSVMPSPTFGGARILMRGGHCAPAVYVQGMQELDRGVLPVLDPHAIRGVEVYRGSSEVPAQWGGAFGACGVVLIWLF